MIFADSLALFNTKKKVSSSAEIYCVFMIFVCYSMIVGFLLQIRITDFLHQFVKIYNNIVKFRLC